MESLEEADYIETSHASTSVSNEAYASELVSLLNCDALQTAGCSSGLYKNSVKEDSPNFKTDSKLEDDLPQLGHHVNLSSIATNGFHCDNLQDVTENMLLSTENSFNEGLLDYSMSNNKNTTSALNCMDNENCVVASEIDIQLKLSSENLVTADKNPTAMLKSASDPECTGLNISGPDGVKEEKETSMALPEIEKNTSNLQSTKLTLTVLPIPHEYPDGDGDLITADLPQQPETFKEKVVPKLDDNQSKSDDEFNNNTSPISSEELSLDSGVASLDDQETTQTSKGKSFLSQL